MHPHPIAFESIASHLLDAKDFSDRVELAILAAEAHASGGVLPRITPEEIEDAVHQAQEQVKALRAAYDRVPVSAIGSHDSQQLWKMGEEASKTASQVRELSCVRHALWAATDPQRAAKHAAAAAKLFHVSCAPELWHEYEALLMHSTQAGKAADWCVPEHLFALHLDFSEEIRQEGGHLIEVAGVIDAELIRYFGQHPDRLHGLTPRQFEELVAELFHGFGYQVELTRRTRDGRADVVALKRDIVEVKYLIECKRYAPQHKVGIHLVRCLHGVTVAQGATKGILATTSCFTQGARAHLSKHPFLLQGADFDALVQWLDLYDKSRLMRQR
jgi:hypothetical protein